MPETFNQGSFVPTTNVWDVNEIYSTDVTSPEFRELLVRLYQNLNLMSLVLNTKTTGYYILSEYVDGNVWFEDPLLNSTTPQTPEIRQEFRYVMNFGALPNAGTKSVPHTLNTQYPGGLLPTSWRQTNLYGAATDPTGRQYIPLPFSSPVLNENISLSMDNVNITVTTAIDYSMFTEVVIIIEYLKA